MDRKHYLNMEKSRYEIKLKILTSVKFKLKSRKILNLEQLYIISRFNRGFHDRKNDNFAKRLNQFVEITKNLQCTNE
jgi:hypothetical protein